jgi:transcriptional regulator with XRE-family HTH domain
MRGAILRRVGAQIRTARVSTEASQQELGDLFGWGRDAISKLELGTLNVSLFDYLLLVDYLGEHMPPDHPALALLKFLTRPVD